MPQQLGWAGLKQGHELWRGRGSGMMARRSSHHLPTARGPEQAQLKQEAGGRRGGAWAGGMMTRRSSHHLPFARDCEQAQLKQEGGGRRGVE